MRIYFIRHGETNWNLERRLQGQVDIPLNDYGVELAEETAKRLADIPFECAWSSPLSRAKQTAQIIIGDRNVPLEEDPRLLEISFGIREGDCFADVTEGDPIFDFLHNPEQYCPPHGAESMQELYERGRQFLEEVIKPLEGSYETVLVVSHSACIHGILNPIAEIALRDFWKIKMKNCCVSVLQLKDGVFTIEEVAVCYANGRV